MKQLLLIAALLVPSMAFATAPQPEEFEQRVALEAEGKLASGPKLPFASDGTKATSCGMSIDPLPDVMVLHLGQDIDAMLAFCFTQ